MLDGVVTRRMVGSDMAAACEVIGLALADNQNTLAIVGGDRARTQRTAGAGVRVAKLGRTCSHALVAEAAGRIVGVLNAAESPSCQVRMGEKLWTAPVMIRVLGPALPRAFKMMRTWAKHDPPERHWREGPIGVHPEFQGRGIGKALLGSFLEMVDERRSPAYLETDVDRNVLLYEKFGFKVIAEEGMLGVNSRFLWRPGRSAVA